MIDHANYIKISSIEYKCFSNFFKSTETILSPFMRNFIVNSIQIRLYNNIHREIYHNLKDQLENETK
jgi:hypothetical protein